MKTTTTRQYNFNYENSSQPSTEEYKIIQKLSSRLLYQTQLVNECLAKEIFQYEDMKNIYSPCEDCEACKAGDQCDNEIAAEVYYWIAYSDDSDYVLERLDKAGRPYINNDFGLWIGRTDCGSAQDIYFLPSLADALYNHEIDSDGKMIMK